MRYQLEARQEAMTHSDRAAGESSTMARPRCGAITREGAAPEVSNRRELPPPLVLKRPGAGAVTGTWRKGRVERATCRDCGLWLKGSASPGGPTEREALGEGMP